MHQIYENDEMFDNFINELEIDRFEVIFLIENSRNMMPYQVRQSQRAATVVFD
jgi:hypothetical protein